MTRRPRLLLATHNSAKLRELRSLFCAGEWELVSLEQQGIELEVPEEGQTLEENAAAKAIAYAKVSGLISLADDSGLEVEALGGGPGPLSARYAGEGASDMDKISRLLSELAGIPWEKRKARFRCVIAVASPSGRLELCQGECQGVITFEPRGKGGFGYDPVFFLPKLGRTMAELSLEEKNWVSHRGKAARKALEVLRRILNLRGP
ncbi:MAG: non-canonical purine NTP pyrophosphatase, RdgB/HAM1 family [Chloroflexi bacterium]|nr:MAG: non-canonical purine NTP pyrophosphatase, RdgB/HAM1 family [Chloroflexota bacterium]